MLRARTRPYGAYIGQNDSNRSRKTKRKRVRRNSVRVGWTTITTRQRRDDPTRRTGQTGQRLRRRAVARRLAPVLLPIRRAVFSDRHRRGRGLRSHGVVMGSPRCVYDSRITGKQNKRFIRRRRIIFLRLSSSSSSSGNGRTSYKENNNDNSDNRG